MIGWAFSRLRSGGHGIGALALARLVGYARTDFTYLRSSRECSGSRGNRRWAQGPLTY
jgi:hypothetical protein